MDRTSHFDALSSSVRSPDRTLECQVRLMLAAFAEPWHQPELSAGRASRTNPMMQPDTFEPAGAAEEQRRKPRMHPPQIDSEFHLVVRTNVGAIAPSQASGPLPEASAFFAVSSLLQR